MKNVVAVNIGKNEIRGILLTKEKNHWKPTNVYFKEYTNDYVDTLKKIWKKEKISTNKVILVLSGNQTIIKKINVNSIEKSAIEVQLKEKIEDYVPFTARETVCSWKILNNKETHTILFAGTKIETIKEQMKILEDAKLKPVGISVTTVSLLEFLNMNKFDRVCLVHMNESSIETIIIDDSILQMNYSTKYVSNENATEIIRKVLNSYSNRGKIEKIVFTGEIDLIESVNEKLNLSIPTEIFSNIETTFADLIFHPVSFKNNLDLLHGLEFAEERKVSKVPLLTKVGVGGLAVLFIFTILLVYFTLSQERYVEQLEEEYASISDLKSENVKQWFLILNLLEKSLPEDVYVHTLKIEDNGDVYIRIISKSYDGIMQFYNAIINKKMFEQIKQGSISKFTEAGSYLYKFDIKAKLTSKK